MNAQLGPSHDTGQPRPARRRRPDTANTRPGRSRGRHGQLRATAVRLIRMHVKDDGPCASCRLTWPCPTASQAALTLGTG